MRMRVMQGENEGSERTSESRSMNKRGIIIANTGSPSAPTPEAVRAYLRDFLSDPRICPMNPTAWNFILEHFILPKRSVASAQKYASIWTPDGSPLVLIMDLLATRLQHALDEESEGSLVRSAMSYGQPSISDVLADLRGQGCDEIIVIPLYPQGAFSTTKVVEDKVRTVCEESDWHPRLQVVEDYCTHERYTDAIVRSIEAAGFIPEEDMLLLAFHSIPIKDIEAGDTYHDRVRESCETIARGVRARKGAWAIAFQCRFDKSRKWLGPSTAQVIDQLRGHEGRLFVVAPNFSIDCLETLYDIEVELKEMYRASRSDLSKGDFVYVPCLNDSDDQVELLRALCDAGTLHKKGASAC